MFIHIQSIHRQAIRLNLMNTFLVCFILKRQIFRTTTKMKTIKLCNYLFVQIEMQTTL